MCEKYIYVCVYIVGILIFFENKFMWLLGIVCKEKDNIYFVFKF